MFCPNCGTQNPDAATTCSKCGFNLKGAAAPKFKGTMLMMNTPPQGPRPAGAPNPPAPGAAPPPPGAPPPGPVPGAPPAAGAPAPAARPHLKGTMLGVAPPPGAFGAPAAGAPPPQARPGFPSPGAPPAPAAQPPGPSYGGPVNPLGGTMVADPGSMGASNPYAQHGQPPQPAGPPGGVNPYGPPPGSPGMGSPYGSPPGGPGMGSPYGPPPGGPGMGSPYGPPPGGVHGSPHDVSHAGPGGYNPPPPAFGGPPPPPPAFGTQAGGPGFGQSPYGSMQHAPPHDHGQFGMQSMGAIPGAAPMVPAGGYSAHGAHGPLGNVRNPITTTVIGMVCFVYALFVLWTELNELNAYRQKNDINPILLFVPILNLIMIWNLPEKVLDAKHMAGIPNPQVVHPILYLLLSPYFLTTDLNEIFQASGAPPL